MTQTRDEVMFRLYGRDIWEGFEPLEVQAVSGFSEQVQRTYNVVSPKWVMQK